MGFERISSDPLTLETDNSVVQGRPVQACRVATERGTQLRLLIPMLSFANRSRAEHSIHAIKGEERKREDTDGGGLQRLEKEVKKLAVNRQHRWELLPDDGSCPVFCWVRAFCAGDHIRSSAPEPRISRMGICHRTAHSSLDPNTTSFTEAIAYLGLPDPTFLACLGSSHPRGIDGLARSRSTVTTLVDPRSDGCSWRGGRAILAATRGGDVDALSTPGGFRWNRRYLRIGLPRRGRNRIAAYRRVAPSVRELGEPSEDVMAWGPKRVLRTRKG
jgi:hypothetical protein